jgi:hypothetical protein
MVVRGSACEAASCTSRNGYELLFLCAIPDFEPSPESYAVAVEVFSKEPPVLTAGGLVDDADIDPWTTLVAGLASQQLANDPGGDRYIRLIDDAVEMFAEHVFRKQAPKRDTKA